MIINIKLHLQFFNTLINKIYKIMIKSHYYKKKKEIYYLKFFNYKYISL